MALRTVYPRVCGGTDGRRVRVIAHAGLSPRVRGNLVPPDRSPRRRGSIPACAGEPFSVPLRLACVKVYPRVCGGTASTWEGLNGFQGLSPRVRGNPATGGATYWRTGSIPACAGEPPCPVSRRPCRWVYPRVCGGTSPRVCDMHPARGLSPRVRGNRIDMGRAERLPRSIPACAGEPQVRRIDNRFLEVYPRVCGGTAMPCSSLMPSPGLSPRVRGNRSRSST